MFERLTGPHIAELLWHLPTDIIDRSFQPTIAEAPPGRIATLTVKVETHEKPHNPRQPYRVRCRDGSGTIDLVFFHAKGDYLERALPLKSTRLVSGKVERFHGQAQMTHPDHILAPAAPEKMRLIEPVYGLTAGLTLRVVQ